MSFGKKKIDIDGLKNWVDQFGIPLTAGQIKSMERINALIERAEHAEEVAATLKAENVNLRKKLSLFGRAQCEHLHHPKKYQGHNPGKCPIEMYLNGEITTTEFNGYMVKEVEK